ncbi:DUF1641 domain-containing protein [Saccharolobus solfataricus]|uniref:DUF1641 domain-containing protein n=3 Tax=Saccharolobus solfataricus TaxID=2287 RepID=Q97V14_SACS2|nr:DUF1641 domain-containing protein [Saccharolobus solfataricus]AAK42933.1 Hypothetical protein SSO2822 [Saccharolobus solfataricus P2]AKA73024.1 DUF1641 domain-containing protein [Saccharolobus solfataricus]AKA75722.1 DUF1641 domain-containing protein [Saccharolobus solfataricus]AKA78414.1 DUF1641 domain-containing protein [Saccharolobus solfataricus]AZF67532.1 DUF1641 domain-containing protein [Saccharolobus solfataricus]
MEEGGVQAIDGLIEQLIESREALENFLKLINTLQKTGILPLLVGMMNTFDQNLAFLAEQNAVLIRNINIIYSILSGKEEAKDISLTELTKQLNDPDVKRGLYLLLKILKAIGSASKEV